ncbi:MAG: hypothetical protein RIC95_09720 [Vicingaceae bacterium]
MQKLRTAALTALICSISFFACQDDEPTNPAGPNGNNGNGGNNQPTVSADGYTLIKEDASGDATWFPPGQQDRVPGGLDGTKLEYRYLDSLDQINFRFTVVNLNDFSSSPSFDLNFVLPNGTVPPKGTGVPFNGNTLTHKTAAVYTDNGGTPPNTYSYNQTNQFAVNGMGYTADFGPSMPHSALKSICENCIDFNLDVPNNQINVTIDRKLIIKNEEIDSTSRTATIQLVANLGYQRVNNDKICDGESFQIRLSNTINLNGLPSLSATAATNITSRSATLSAAVSDSGSSPVTLRGFCYAETSNPTLADSVLTQGSGNGNFTASVQNLRTANTYYVRAFATNAKGTAYGPELSFTTLAIDTVPLLQTNAVFNITHSSGRLSGTVLYDGNRPILERGFVVTEMPNPNPNLDSNFRAFAPGLGTGTYYTNLTILPSKSTFYIRAYAKNDLGVGFGNEVQFTTIDTTASPTVLTLIAINITQSSAYCGLDVVDNNNSAVSEGGLVYSTSPNPTLADSKVMVQNINPGPDSYGLAIPNLQANTTYYYKGYATNGFGTNYGQQREFKTNP